MNVTPIRPAQDAIAAANAIIYANMQRESDRSEALLRECRKLLGFAREVFPVNVELADAFAARAANKLALAIGARA